MWQCAVPGEPREGLLGHQAPPQDPQLGQSLARDDDVQVRQPTLRRHGGAQDHTQVKSCVKLVRVGEKHLHEQHSCIRSAALQCC